MEPEAKYTVVGTAALILRRARGRGGRVAERERGGQATADVTRSISRINHSRGSRAAATSRCRGSASGRSPAFVLVEASRRGGGDYSRSADDADPPEHPRRVERQLVTGLASIRLVNLSEDSPLLTKPPPGEPYPVIAEGESEFQQFSESVTELAHRANETMRRIDRVLSDENQAALAETLDNLRHLSRNADRAVARLDGTLSSVARAADEVRSMSSGIANNARTLGARYDTLGEEATTAFRELTADIRRISSDAAQLSERASDLLASGDMELRFTAREVRAAADSVGSAANKLGDLRTELFGPAEGALGPGRAQNEGLDRYRAGLRARHTPCRLCFLGSARAALSRSRSFQHFPRSSESELRLHAHCSAHHSIKLLRDPGNSVQPGCRNTRLLPVQ